MADASFEFSPGRFGRDTPHPGLQVRELRAAAIASVVARHGQATAASAAATRAWGLELPATGHAVASAQVALLGLGPGQWVATPASTTDGDVEASLSGVFAGTAAVFDQSGGRIVLELGGPRVREVLAKGFSIDLHPSVFGPGHVASTRVSHLNVQLWQVSDEPRYRVFVVRTWFDGFWRWLSASAAEYGGEVLSPGAYSPT